MSHEARQRVGAGNTQLCRNHSLCDVESCHSAQPSIHVHPHVIRLEAWASGCARGSVRWRVEAVLWEMQPPFSQNCQGLRAAGIAARSNRGDAVRFEVARSPHLVELLANSAPASCGWLLNSSQSRRGRRRGAIIISKRCLYYYETSSHWWLRSDAAHVAQAIPSS